MSQHRFSLFWSILAGTQNFAKSFWAKLGQKFFFKKNIFFSTMNVLASQMDWEPPGPKIGPLNPLQDPILAYLGHLGPLQG